MNTVATAEGSARTRDIPSVKLTSDDFAHPEKLAERMASGLGQSKILHLRGRWDGLETLKLWGDLMHALGEPSYEDEDSDSGAIFAGASIWSDVSYRAALQHTFRHSCTAQPLHTDGAYGLEPTEAVILICESSAPAGGETVFVTASDVADLVSKTDPGLFQDLLTIPLPYAKVGTPGPTTPFFTQHGDDLLVNWNYYRVLKDESPEIRRLAERVHRFLEEEFVAKGRVMPVTLAPGEAVLFDDRRVLHGRAAFAPGPRRLWKCCLTRRIR